MNAAESLSVRASAADAVLSDLFEEIAAKMAAGEPVDLAAYAAKYPDHAEQLRRLLPAVQVLADLGVSAARGELASTPRIHSADLERGVLGDFQILREIGRGGMGIVYEAEQISLGRRVALKVLPFAAALDAKHLQRFKNEAQAAAHLRHPNIVPVYAVGCERGVHYYAMQYVDGHTVAGLIQELRQLAGLGQARDNGTSAPASAVVSASAANNLASKLISGRWAPGKQISADSQETGPYSPSPAGNSVPSAGYAVPAADTSPKGALSTEQGVKSPGFFRTVANLGVQAAEALEHAHQLGVIHRDVKPANLLVDGEGQLWITDFGLARLGGDAGLTMTGDLLGTIRYMSPEQALAKRVTVDARTDVYSLGVTLYELLTLEPAYKGKNREEVLRQIAFEEPRAPGRVNSSIPPELETIVLKAMAKNPEERYATALELADDLGSYLEDKPIKAKRPSLRQRAAKWARRHKTVVRAAVIVLVLALVALMVSTALIWRSLERERQSGYFQRIALAERAWAANNLGWAEHLLEECPPDLRGWEWYYLKRLRYKVLSPLHQDSSVLSAVFSADGERIASSGQDGFITIWDARSGHQFLHFPTHESHARSVAFSPDGRRLATGSWDGTVKIWDVQTLTMDHIPAPLHILRHGGQVWKVVFSPDGQRLASCGEPGPDSATAHEDGFAAVKIWDPTSGQELDSLEGREWPVWAVAFSPDSRWLATGSRAGQVKVWEARTGREKLTFRGHSLPIQGVAFSPDGRCIASGAGTYDFDRSDSELKVWDARTGRELLDLRGHIGKVQAVAFSPDGRRLASAGRDQIIKLWDTTTGHEALTLRGHLDDIRTLAFSLDGHQLVSASDDMTMRIWDATPRQEQPDPAYLTLRGHAGGVGSVVFSLAGQSLASASVDKTVKIWDAFTGKELMTLRGHGDMVHSIAFSPDGQCLASGSKDRTVKTWDTDAWKEIHTFDSTGSVESVSFSPDGKFLAAGDHLILRIWDTTTGQQIHGLHDHNWMILCVAFDRTGRLVASASVDSNVRIWDVQNGKELRKLQPKHAGRTTSVAFSSDGKSLASASVDRTVKIWDTRNWELLRDIPDSTGGIECVAFAPDSRRIAWGSTDSTVKVADATTGQILETLRGHTSWVKSVAFSPDGKRLASASLDGTVRIWKAPPVPELPRRDVRNPGE